MPRERYLSSCNIQEQLIESHNHLCTSSYKNYKNPIFYNCFFTLLQDLEPWPYALSCKDQSSSHSSLCFSQKLHIPFNAYVTSFWRALGICLQSASITIWKCSPNTLIILVLNYFYISAGTTSLSGMGLNKVSI